MRPNSIRWFDRLFLSSLAIGLVNSALAYQRAREAIAGDSSSHLLQAANGGAAATVLVGLLMWFFISRRASRILRNFFTLFYILGLLAMPLVLRSAAMTSPLDLALILIVTLLQAGAVYCLFRPDARAWFAARGKPVDPAIFE
jgi:hypothetical protein